MHASKDEGMNKKNVNAVRCNYSITGLRKHIRPGLDIVSLELSASNFVSAENIIMRTYCTMRVTLLVKLWKKPGRCTKSTGPHLFHIGNEQTACCYSVTALCRNSVGQ